jgi:hypothetical protein
MIKLGRLSPCLLSSFDRVMPDKRLGGASLAISAKLEGEPSCVSPHYCLRRHAPVSLSTLDASPEPRGVELA